MDDYRVEFLKVALAHLLAVASPGPDFAVVLRQSLRFGRRTAIWTSLGVGMAIFWHVSYVCLGLGWLVHSGNFGFSGVKWAGAACLAWMGWQSLRALPTAPRLGEPEAGGVDAPRARRAFAVGFFTNALNPKAALFFVSLFALVVSPLTPGGLQLAYGVWMAVVTMAWFCLVAVVFTRRDVQARFRRYSHWIDRSLGVVLLGFAVSLALATR